MSEISSDEINVEDELKDDEGVVVNYDIATYPSDYTLRGIFDLVKAKTVYICLSPLLGQ